MSAWLGITPDTTNPSLAPPSQGDLEVGSMEIKTNGEVCTDSAAVAVQALTLESTPPTMVSVSLNVVEVAPCNEVND